MAETLPLIPKQPGCSCHNALKTAFLTDQKLWPAKRKAELKPILAKYL